jgi:hypothetical protein
MMRHDVVELAGDASPFLHHRPRPNILRHRLLARPEGFHCHPPFAHRLADDEGGEEDHERRRARKTGLVAVVRRPRVDDEREKQRNREQESASDHQVRDQKEQDADAGDGQRRAGRGQDRRGREDADQRGGEGPSPRRNQREDGHDVQDDRRVRRTLFRRGWGATRLERRGRHKDGGDPSLSGATREQPLHRAEQPPNVAGVHHPIVVALSAAAPRTG